jgi:hypothetical protein
MNVLGRDGADLELARKEKTKPANADDNLPNDSSSTRSNSEDSNHKKPASPRARSRKKLPPTDMDSSPAMSNASSAPWWGKRVWGAVSQDDDDASNYQSLEAPLGDGRFSHPLQRVDYPTVAAAAITPTTEDQLRQDCSFFYQGLEDITPRKENRGLRPLSSALDKVPRVLSRRDGAMFHAKYEQLNQDIAAPDEDYDDLYLHEGSSETVDFQSDTHSNNVVDVQHSTLVYEQNGRMLMKLPRDQVRLIMDQDLEPGIVSVEQWRKELTTPTPNGQSFFESTPELRYVLTVPDDLYRRIVSEMSYAMFPPYFGFFKCCNETERADIKVALAILFVVLVILFISTMEWPTV